MCKCLNGFEERPFPEKKNIVYVILYQKENNEKVPFYVGKSTRHLGRLGDYVSAKFSAQTDFKVGETINYLRENKGYRIVVKYSPSNDIESKEREIMEKLEQGGYKLLNKIRLPYNYEVDNKERVKAKLIECINSKLL